MLHEPAASSGPDHAIGYKMRVGVVMFFIYAIVYAGFVIINVTNPDLMETRMFAGLNLATVYGFGLIAFALFLAIIYTSMCSIKEKALNFVPSEEGR